MADPSYQPFIHAHPEWYDSFDRYLPGDELLRVARAAVPATWSMRRSGIWLHLIAPDVQLPRQGWKIHVSATPSTCEAVLERVAAVCVRHQAPFKCAIDRRAVRLMSSKRWPREALAKFITVYPGEAHFRAVIESLHEALRDSRGPQVLSDRRFKDGRSLYYRYGNIAGPPVLTATGRRQPMLISPDGQAEPDACPPFWDPPAWVADPFPAEEGAGDGGPGLQGGRYQVHEVMRFSGTGGTYKATDLDTGATVVLKEAIPLAGFDDGGLDAADRLRKEHRLLQRLADTGVVPRPVDLFLEEEHLFLVEEFVPGRMLSRVTETANPFVTGAGTREELEAHAKLLMQVWSSLALAVERLHARGVALGGLSTRDVMVTQLETGAVRIIDLEEAREDGGAASVEDDLYSLGAAFASSLCPPAAELLSLEPGAAPPLVALGGRALGVPEPVLGLALDCLGAAGGRPGTSRMVETIRRHRTPEEPVADPPGPEGDALLGLVEAAVDHVRASAEPHRPDRLFPGDPSLFGTNPLNVASGACGVAYALARIRGEVPAPVRSWMLSQPVTPDRYPPGLYVGSAGVAWAMWEMGLPDVAVQVLGAAHQHPLLHDSAGLFHGASGYGLTCLRFHRGTGQQAYLDRAAAVGEWLLRTRVERAGASRWPDKQGAVAAGYAHGPSGVALFLLSLSQATGDARFLEVGRTALEHDLARPPAKHCWLEGRAGVGAVAARFWKATGDARYLDALARLAPDAAPPFMARPGLFEGLAGLGNFLLDAHASTGEARYLRQASVVAGRVSRFAVKRPAGIAFPGAGPGAMRLSTDLGTGSAGIALFLHRLAHAGERPGDFNFTLDPWPSSS